MCPDCSTDWYKCALHEAGYENQLCTCPDDLEMDATDFAHPAWWRGADHGTSMTAKALLNHIKHMECGTSQKPNFSSPELNELFDRIEQLNDRVAHTREWYAVRMERLKDFAKEKGIWHEVASILANGTMTGLDSDGKWVYDPPTYAQQMNMLKWQVEKLQKELADAKEKIARLQDRSKPDESA
jgi:hypothetical protein